MDGNQMGLPWLGKNPLLLPRISPDLTVGGKYPSRAPCVPIPEDPSLQGALSTQQGDTGRNELDSGLMLITGFQFPGLKRDSSHSSAFICVILVQNEIKTETSHFTSHFGVFQLRPAPVGVVISQNAPTSRRQLQAVPQCRAGDEAVTWRGDTVSPLLLQTQLAHLQVISRHSKQLDMRFPVPIPWPVLGLPGCG